MRKLVGGVLLAFLVTGCGGGVAVPSPTPSPTVTASAAASPTALTVAIDHHVVYAARDRLPPVAVHVDAAGMGATSEARVLSRITSLFRATVAAPLFNVALNTWAVPIAVVVDGDLVTIDFRVPSGDWGVAGSAALRAFVQQLVFTATEEPGIRRALFTENGGLAIIGGQGLVVDHPATREDVAGYAATTVPNAFMWRTESHPERMPVTTTITVDDAASAMARLVIDTGLRGAAAKGSIGVAARLMRNDERAFPDLGKWALSVSVADARTADAIARPVERTPVRMVRATNGPTGLRYEIGLDDARPWRVAMLYEPLRIVIDIGGDPDAVSPNIALHRPIFGSTLRADDRLSGWIRAFEGRFEHRILDAQGSVVVDAFATASLGTAEMWGTFDLALPPLRDGAYTVEILLRSPKDGAVSERVFTSFRVGSSGTRAADASSRAR